MWVKRGENVEGRVGVGGDFIRRDDSDRDNGDGDVLGRNGGDEALGILAQGSPIEADMGSVESESDISKGVNFLSHHGAVEGDTGVSGLDRLRGNFLDGTTESAEELGWEETAFMVGDSFFGKTRLTRWLAVEARRSPASKRGEGA